jgi:5-methylcytosine-specific restriction protein A
MPKCYQLIGVPGAGKSTWLNSQNWIEGMEYVSTDHHVHAYAKEQGKTYKEVFEEFSSNIQQLHQIAIEIKQITSNSELSSKVYRIEDDETSDTDSVREGQILYKLHKVRERDRKIITAKKTKVLKETGSLKCEACKFDFEETYGKLGKGYIECHHLIPLANFQVNKETKLESQFLGLNNSG